MFSSKYLGLLFTLGNDQYVNQRKKQGYWLVLSDVILES